jgi:hypothetical protein
MVGKKAALIGLLAFSLCRADISGIVTDSAGAGLSGVVVKLEKGGQTDTSESNGSFTLSFGATGIGRQIDQPIHAELSGAISHEILRVNTPVKSALEITIFDLTGKALSTVRQTIDAGSHFLSLDYPGSGIYLCRVKSGGSEFVLKGNTVGGVSSGSALSAQSSSLPLSKPGLPVKVVGRA